MLFALAIFHSTYFCRLLAKKRRGTPSSCFLLVFTAYACFLKFKLILSGDIHVNPGPTNPHTMCGRFKFGHWNVNSLLARNKAKIPLIEALQSIHNFDLFAISESFLNLNTNISDLKIHGFSPVPLRNDCNRANIHPQGGVCLYHKEHVPLVHRTDLQFLDECIICEVKIDKNKKMFFIAVYRSPSQSPPETNNFFLNLDKIISSIKKENPAIIIIAGDLNARSPLIWSEESFENLAGEKLSELITLENFSQCIDEPTHHPSDEISTCIDLILTSNFNAITDHGVLPSLDDKCKHQIIHGQVNFRVPPPPKYKRLIWDYKACNADALKKSIRDFDWAHSFNQLNVHEMVDFFTNKLTNLAKIHIPSKQISVSDSDAPWINNKLKTAIKKNKKIYSNWVKNGKTRANKVFVNRSQRDTNKLIREAKANYVKSLSTKICDPDSGCKVFWSAFKRLLNNKKITNIPPLLFNGNFITNFKEKASIFNDYFAKQCKIFVNNSVLPHAVNPLPTFSLRSILINESDIISIISKLNPKKAHGIDGISSQLLKMCPNEIAIPLKLIFEKALSSCQYPNLWKRANVQPVHKKNSRQDVSNYRPISLLCICGKIFEKIIFDQMYTFLMQII